MNPKKTRLLCHLLTTKHWYEIHRKPYITHYVPRTRTHEYLHNCFNNSTE